MKILEMNQGERPREKMLERGRESLSDAELLAVILRTGNGRDNALDLARKLLDSYSGRLCSLGNACASQMQAIEGIGPGKALSIEAAFELGRRFFQGNNNEDKRPVSSPMQVFKLMLPKLKGLEHEECWVLFLNQSLMTIDIKKICSGGTDSTIIDNKMILKIAIGCLASHIILVHNHPAGNPRPSEADVKMTKALHDSAENMDIGLMDHVIICDGSYYSFADDEVRIVNG